MDGHSGSADSIHRAVDSWVAAYESAWRSEGTAALAEVFVEDAVYRMSPYAEPVRGLAAIAELWERERAGPDEEFELRHEVVAVEGGTAVVRAEVEYGTGAEYRDLWIVRPRRRRALPPTSRSGRSGPASRSPTRGARADEVAHRLHDLRDPRAPRS